MHVSQPPENPKPPESPVPPEQPIPPRLIGLIAIFIVVGLFLLLRPKHATQEASDSATTPATGKQHLPHQDINVPTTDDAMLKRGKELSEQVCQTCHLLPLPEHLDRFTWAMSTLPMMSTWVGIVPEDFDKEPGGHFVKEAGIIPPAPLMSLNDWRALCSYYLAYAPLRPLPQTNKPPIKVGLKGFKVEFPPYRFGRPMTTLVKIDEPTHHIYLCDGETKQLVQLNSQGKMEASIGVESPVVHMGLLPDRMLLTMIGDIYPSHERKGRLVSLPRAGYTNSIPHSIMQDLARSTDAQFADLNGDGRTDIVLCQYGNMVGKFAWYEQKPDGTYKEHVLLDRAGAIRSYVYDFNHDGKPDIIVQMAQGREGIYLFINQGNGEFEQRTVVENIPSWGNSYFELVDFNGDGAMDILVTNGDNGDVLDFPNSLKPYHGIRLLLNDGQNNFKEAWFYPMYGAYKAHAADYYGTGRLSIAAIAFFPDYHGVFKESFVMLENKGNMNFEASTFPESISGRWITFDAGDIDGDGDIDIVLGAFNRSFRDVPEVLTEQWEKKGPSVLILRNTLHDK